MGTVFIGVAWPYANGAIHVGHVAGSLLAPDIFARYHRMRGDTVLMVSGSDMHGAPITVRAEEENTSPGELAERYHRINEQAIRDLGIAFDVYESTEHPTHVRVAREWFAKLHRAGHIVLKAQRLPYCPNHRRFLPDRYVEGTCPHCGAKDARGDQCDKGCGELLDPQQLIEPRCKQCGTTPEFRDREHFFFRLSAFEEPLKAYVADKGHWRPNVIHFTRRLLEEGLRDRPVSRDLPWGIDVPVEGHEDKKIYVWFEAFMGYFSMAVEWARRQGDEERWREFWTDPACHHYYFLGKDNIPFHTIFWPAVLLAHGGLNLPYDVPANEFLRFGGEAFSKSRGVTVEIPDLLRTYGPDAVRYYLAAVMPETRDSEFSWEELAQKNNSELLAVFGNFAHRTLVFAHRHWGAVPPGGDGDAVDKGMVRRIEEQSKRVADHLDACRFRDALREAIQLARYGNQYFDQKAPWDLLKRDRDECGRALHVCLRTVKALNLLLAPFLPHASDRLWRMLGHRDSVHGHRWDETLEDLPAGQVLPEPQPLFAPLVVAGEEREENRLDVRVAHVLAVEDHPKADKLYVLEIDVGGERRRIVTGLKDDYRREDLQGRRIVVLCNLQPAKLRGVMSQGMLLAAEKGAVVALLLAPEDASAGTQVLGAPGAPEIDIDAFRRFRFEVNAEGHVAFLGSGGKRRLSLQVNGRLIRTDKGLGEGAVVT